MPEPPAWAERLLKLALPRGPRAASLLGDLAEEYSRRASSGEEAAAARWYRREAMGLGIRFASERAARIIRRERSSDRNVDPRATGDRGTGTPAWSDSRVRDLFQDVRHAGRHLRRSPGVTVTVLLTFALGIGANAGTFAFVDAMAFRPLPVQEPERLVALFGRAAGSDDLIGFSNPDYIDYRDGTQSVFAGVAGFSDTPASLGLPGGAVMVWTNLVTPDYFQVLRPRARLGRVLDARDEDAVVLSHGLWQRRFGADRGIVGRTIMLNGHPFTVVGVTEQGFTGTRLFAYAPELWVPTRAHLQIEPGSDGVLYERDRGWLQVVARLAPEVSMEQARTAVRRVAQGLGTSFPETHAGREVVLYSNARPVNPWAFEPSQLQTAGLVALAGVALVLLIACANVAGLQLAQSTARRREVAVRVSLGAGRLRVARSLIIESLMLSLGGGVLGIVLAIWLVRTSSELQPPLDFAPAFDARIDWRVISFTALASTFAAVLAGLLPVLRQRTVDPATTLRAETGGASRSSRLLDGLVVAQMAFSLVVLVAAGLFTQSLRNARNLDPGFSLENGLVVTVDPTLQGYSMERADAFYERLLAELRALPGVRGATRAAHLPLDGSAASARVSAEGKTVSADEQTLSLFYAVEPGFFAALGTPVLEGRGLTKSDDAGAPLVAIVNETLARTLWPDEPAIGRRMQVGDDVASVVGIAPDIKLMFLREAPQPMLALSLRQVPAIGGAILVRTAGDPLAFATEVRRTIRSIDPQLALMGLKTLRESAAYTFTAAESGAFGATTFGVLALLLTAAGLYGVIAWGVARRVREIGIRMALGAHANHVVGMVVRHGLRLTAIGLAIGLALALATGRLLSGLLYGVAPTDLAIFAAVAALLTLVALLASWAPSKRATSVDPLSVLRAD